MQPDHIFQNMSIARSKTHLFLTRNMSMARGKTFIPHSERVHGKGQNLYSSYRSGVGP